MKLTLKVTRLSIFLGVIIISMAARSNDRIPGEHTMILKTSLAAVSHPGVDSLIPNVMALPLAGSDSLNRDSVRPVANKYVWMQGGVQADELFYPNERLHIGYGNVYAIVSWNEDCCLSHLRYGAGYVRPLSNGWQLHGTATLGFTKIRYPQSATLPKVTVKNGLYKLSTLVEKNISRSFSIQAGPVINGLHTRYFSYSQQGVRQPVAAGTLLPSEMDGDKTYVAIEAPYTLVNTYRKTTTGNWKVWIGAELGIYYKIRFSFKSKDQHKR